VVVVVVVVVVLLASLRKISENGERIALKIFPESQVRT
jgi:hypothetical protein